MYLLVSILNKVCTRNVIANYGFKIKGIKKGTRKDALIIIMKSLLELRTIRVACELRSKGFLCRTCKSGHVYHDNTRVIRTAPPCIHHRFAAVFLVRLHLSPLNHLQMLSSQTGSM